MNKLLCKFGIHDWTWGEIVEESWTKYDNWSQLEREYSRNVQTATCSCCGKAKLRYLN